MRRREITSKHLEEILKIFALGFLSPERVADIQTKSDEFPFIWSLFYMEPEDLVKIFHEGSLMHDLQRVGGVNWSWHVSTIADHLKIWFYKNIPNREKTKDLNELETRVNSAVAAYLQANTR